MALVGVVATRFGLGSHYDVSGLTFVPVALTGDAYSFVPGTWRQIFWLTLVPQLLVWPVFTVVAGMAGAASRGRPRVRETARPPLRGRAAPGGRD